MFDHRKSFQDVSTNKSILHYDSDIFNNRKVFKTIANEINALSVYKTFYFMLFDRLLKFL